MPWKECDIMSEKMKFVSRLLAGERMSDLCREFDVSRKTGYKFFDRYKELGLEGLRDQSRAAVYRPNQTARAIERSIVELRNEHPTWGAPKIKSSLERRCPIASVPACSTIHAILQRHNLVKRMNRRALNYKSKGTDLEIVTSPNKLWCTDFKGQFRMGNQQYCYPLTLTDQFSRYLIACEGMEKINEAECIDAFTKIFEEYGLPDAIRSDNGVPFASRSHFGLSCLSVYWLRLNIRLERIKPGCPQQNGRHERMHRTLKAEATKPPGKNIISQQEKLDTFREIFNNERPHQSLKMKCPADMYKKSRRAFSPFLEPLEYPDHDQTKLVSKCGSISIASKKVLHVGEPFAGENVGIRRIDDDVWKVSFMSYDLGFYDPKAPRLQIGVNPFLIKSP